MHITQGLLFTFLTHCSESSLLFMIPTHYPHRCTHWNTYSFTSNVNQIHVWRLFKKVALTSNAQNVKMHPSLVLRVACLRSNCTRQSAWKPISIGTVGRKSWRRLVSMCANQRRPACWMKPISAFQRAATQPIAGLHDGEEVTPYIWRERSSFNIISQKKEYR